MSTVVTRYLDKCKAKITEAQEKYGLTDCFHLNLEEEVSPLSVFDDLCLDKEDPKRAEREVVYPLVVFYWDNIRNILELVRINNTMEDLYHKVCQRAFEFCTTYNRVNEFHILRRLLHKHLDNLMDPMQDQSNMKFRVVWSSSTAELQLTTRFRQLEAACQLQLWQEAFNIVADIRVITSLQIVAPRHLLRQAGGRLLGAQVVLLPRLRARQLPRHQQAPEQGDHRGGADGAGRSRAARGAVCAASACRWRAERA